MRELDPRTYGRLLVSHPLLCLSTRSERTNNVMPLTWYMPASQNPPILSFTLTRGCYTHELLRETSECVIGVPDLSLLHEIHYCGLRTGRDVEKTRLLSLSTSRAAKVSPLLLSSCLAHIEGMVWDIRDIGDRVNYFIHIVHLCADELAWTGQQWTGEAELVYHLHGHTYRCKDQEIVLTNVHRFSQVR